jgi:hypothetical protein
MTVEDRQDSELKNIVKKNAYGSYLLSRKLHEARGLALA